VGFGLRCVHLYGVYHVSRKSPLLPLSGVGMARFAYFNPGLYREIVVSLYDIEFDYSNIS
jgi:hypothetical protein